MAEVIEGDNDFDDMSAHSTMTKDDLIALLRNANILSPKKKGSAPTSGRSQSYASDSEDSYSNSSSSAESSSSASDE